MYNQALTVPVVFTNALRLQLVAAIEAMDLAVDAGDFDNFEINRSIKNYLMFDKPLLESANIELNKRLSTV